MRWVADNWRGEKIMGRSRRHDGSRSVGVTSLPNESAGLAFRPERIAVLVPFALVLWLLAWSIIHFRGPHGVFAGTHALVIYALIVPLTVVINRLHLIIARLPATEMVDAIAITLAVATTIDGVCIAFYPQVYGVDEVTLRRSAAWLL